VESSSRRLKPEEGIVPILREGKKQEKLPKRDGMGETDRRRGREDLELELEGSGIISIWHAAIPLSTRKCHNISYFFLDNIHPYST
jgi:hypothetical protein